MEAWTMVSCIPSTIARKVTYRDIDETIGDARRSPQRLRQQPVHFVCTPKQPSSHIQFKRVELIDLNIMFVVVSEIDTCSSGKADKEPNGAFIGIEKGIPH